MVENGQEDTNVEAVAQSDSPTDIRDRLESLFNRYHKRVFHAAHRITGNPMDAEDALQTVFMRLVRRTGGTALSEDPGSYLHRAAVNAALDIMRSRRSAASTPLEDAEPVLADRSQVELDRQFEGREIRDAIRKALTRLSPNMAEVFALRYFEGYGNHEIAQMMGTSRSTVGVMLHRARHRLRVEISQVAGEAP